MSEALCCPICFDTYSSQPQLVPRILPCGHTLCTKCADGVTKAGFVKCPNRCAEEAKVDGRGAQSLPRNFALLAMGTEETGGGQQAIDHIKIERERLEQAKKAAIAEEDYDKAKQIKTQLEALDARAKDQTKIKLQIEALEAQKAQAVANEDFDLAKRIKDQILSVQALESKEEDSEAVCYDLGPGLGTLLRVAPKPVAKMAARRPLPVVILDRSPSMGGTVRWAVNIAVPAALAKLGYRDDEKCVLLTFDSQTERVGATQPRGSAARVRVDPTVHQLRTLDVACRGTTTLLAPVVTQIRDVLVSANGSCNVFVISDGHVFDLPLVRARADAVRNEVSGLRAVSFALFRFFNGDPPDTAALSAVASVGTYGNAPCSDCFPPAQWTCSTCTFLNPYSVQVCELCQGRAPTRGAEEAVDPSLDTFVDTAHAAFASSVGVHAKVRTEAPLRRLPCGQAEVAEVEVPEGEAGYFLLDRPLSTLYINEKKVSVTQSSVSPEHLDAFCSACLAQLRLWLVGGTRKGELQTAVEWFRRLAVQRQSLEGAARAREGANLLLRAENLRCRALEGESSLGRICMLANASSIIEELTSKQQGDYLRGGSIRRVELSLSRRALGSDIVHHDALRKAITSLSAFEHKEEEKGPYGKEKTVVSYYSGCTYADALRAASVLSDCSTDLPAAEILGVVGGLGAPFAATSPVRPDDIWAWEVSFVDASSFLMEADVWCAKSNGESLTVSNRPVAGVVPLSYCDPEVHAKYKKDLEAVALLHVGSQLRGDPPTQAWGWQVQPPWTLIEAFAARETAALCCVARDHIGGARKVSLPAAMLALGLADQILSSHDMLVNLETVSTVMRILKGEKGLVERKLLPFYAAALCAVAAEDKEGYLNPVHTRELYSREVNKASDKAGIPLRATTQQAAARLDALVQLLAANPDNQKIAVTETLVTKEIQSRFVEAPGGPASQAEEVAVNYALAPSALLVARLPEVTWLPATDTVFGVCRIVRALTSLGTSFSVALGAEKLVAAPAIAAEEVFYGKKGFPGMLFAVAAAAAAYSDLPAPTHIEDDKLILSFLEGLLKTALLTDYRQRLDTEVNQRLAQQRIEEQKQQVFKRAQFEKLQAEKVSEVIRNIAPSLGQAKPPPKPVAEGHPHVSFLLCGHVDSGKSTLAGRLLASMGKLTAKEMDFFQKEATQLGKQSFTFAFAMDRTREERARGITMELSKASFFNSNNVQCTLMDAPGHSDFLRNAVRGIAQADVGILLLPADSFATALDRGNPHQKLRIGNTRLHLLLLLVQGVKQFVVVVNRMDAVNYEQAKFEAAKAAMVSCLSANGLKVENVPILPVSGWAGDNVWESKSHNMPWWQGHSVINSCASSKDPVVVHTLKDVFDKFAVVPPRLDGPFLVPVSAVFKIKGVGTVVTGRVEQGTCENSASSSFFLEEQKVTLVSIEMHHQTLPKAKAGDICGFAIKGFKGQPKVGDLLSSPHRPLVSEFVAQVQVQGSFEYKVGYEPLCIIRTSIVSCRVTKIAWSQQADGKTDPILNPECLKQKDRAEITIKCSVPMPAVAFDECAGLGRIVLLGQDNSVDMIGKITSVVESSPPAVTTHVQRK